MAVNVFGKAVMVKPWWLAAVVEPLSVAVVKPLLAACCGAFVGGRGEAVVGSRCGAFVGGRGEAVVGSLGCGSLCR